MAHDENWGEGEHYKARFFAYLSFFTFAMLMLVTADNLVQMFFGWEGVGVASYLLIGFYYRKPSANAAAIKAFVVNRVGDFGFALGIFALFFLTDSIRLDDVFAAAPDAGRNQPAFPVDGLERGQSDWCACCSSARWGNRRSCSCTHGCPTRWKARPRCRR